MVIATLNKLYRESLIFNNFYAKILDIINYEDEDYLTFEGFSFFLYAF